MVQGAAKWIGPKQIYLGCLTLTMLRSHGINSHLTTDHAQHRATERSNRARQHNRIRLEDTEVYPSIHKGHGLQLKGNFFL